MKDVKLTNFPNSEGLQTPNGNYFANYSGKLFFIFYQKKYSVQSNLIVWAFQLIVLFKLFCEIMVKMVNIQTIKYWNASDVPFSRNIINNCQFWAFTKFTDYCQMDGFDAKIDITCFFKFCGHQMDYYQDQFYEDKTRAGKWPLLLRRTR